jgi:uncharacterized protein with GYD domain
LHFEISPLNFQEGQKGVMKEGSSKRREAAEQLPKSVGREVESFYCAFGGDDIYVIGEFPYHVSVAAVSQLVNSTEAAKVRAVVMLTPEKIDEAAKKTANHRPPSQ